MKEIATLVNLIHHSKFKVKNTLDLMLEPESKIRTMYNAIAGNTAITEDALEEIMQTNGIDPKRSYVVKNKLKERLQDAVLFLNTDEVDPADRDRALVECSKKWTEATILLSKNARAAAIPLLEQLLRQVNRFEFTELAVEVLSALRMHACIMTGNQQAFNMYNQELRKYEDIWQAERLVERTYLELMSEFTITKANQEYMAAQSAAAYERIIPLLEITDSFKIQLYGRLFEIFICDAQKDFEKVVTLSREALRFFEQKNYQSTNVLQVFHYAAATALLNMRRYDACLTQVETCALLFEPGKYNWYKLMEVAFWANMHAGQYLEAAQVNYKVTHCAGFEAQAEFHKEPWKVYEAYLYLIKLAGKMPDDPQLENLLPGRLKLNKLLNDLSLSLKDKSGLNIPVQVLQFLYAVLTRDYNQCIDRQESLAKYRTRYVTLDRDARSHYFLRLLEKLPHHNFNVRLVEPKTTKIFQQLQATRAEAGRHHEVEIVPYETLWEWALQALKTPVKAPAVALKSYRWQKVEPLRAVR